MVAGVGAQLHIQSQGVPFPSTNKKRSFSLSSPACCKLKEEFATWGMPSMALKVMNVRLKSAATGIPLTAGSAKLTE